MNKNELEVKAVKAFESLTTARTALFTAAEVSIMEKFLLEQQRSEATDARPRASTTNAEIRDGQVRELLADQFLKLATAENAERKARRDFDLASIEADAVRTLLRIAELP